jgi:hypothetical protein
MTRTIRILGSLAAAFLVALIVACGAMGGAAARQKTTNDIKQFVLGYHWFIDDNKSKVPADEKEFDAWAATKDPAASAALTKLLAENYRVNWGIKPANLPGGASNAVLIYPASAQADGGLLGFADGSVRTLTAPEFNNAVKPPTR